MSRKHTMLGAALAAGLAVAGIAGSAAAGDSAKIKTEHFTGVPANLTGANGNFAGFNGGGLPWTIGDAEVSVRRSGKVEVEFSDLVFAAGPNTGRNTVAQMRVGVSCMGSDLVRTTALSDVFPVSVADALDPVGGDADATTRIALPATCLAPIVFVTSPGGAWFAVGSL